MKERGVLEAGDRWASRNQNGAESRKQSTTYVTTFAFGVGVGFGIRRISTSARSVISPSLCIVLGVATAGAEYFNTLLGRWAHEKPLYFVVGGQRSNEDFYFLVFKCSYVDIPSPVIDLLEYQ